MKDKMVKINITKMETHLNEFWLKHSLMNCPTDEHNNFNKTYKLFKILKQFEEK